MSAGLAVLALVLAAPPSADTVDLETVVVGKARLVRFQVEVDGKSCRLPWEEYEQRLFTDLDRDDNGHLDRKEAARVPSAAFLRSLLQADTETETGEVIAPFAKLDRDGDGRIQREELF